MNAPELITLPEQPGPTPPAPRAEAPRAEARNPEAQKPKRSTSKIAKLPRKLRDLVNHLLDDGASCAEVAQRLQESTDPPLPYPVSERNINGWFNGGFQDWLRHQDHLELLSSKMDFALDLAQHSSPEKLQELALQLASVRTCEFLSQLALSDPQADTGMYLRLLSVIPRIAKEALNLQKYRDASLNAAPGQAAPAHTPEQVKETLRTALLDHCDDLFGLKSYRQPVTPPLSPPLPPPSFPMSHSPSPISAPSSVEPIPAPSALEISNPKSQIAASAIPPLATPPLPLTLATPPSPPTETHGNPPKPNPNPQPSTLNPQPPQIPSQPSTLNPQPLQEFCLECGHPLPPRLPNTSRPFDHCHNCGALLPLTLCHLPSLERCPYCNSAAPRPNPDGGRPLQGRCHVCTNHLPEPSPEVLSVVDPHSHDRKQIAGEPQTTETYD